MNTKTKDLKTFCCLTSLLILLFVPLYVSGMSEQQISNCYEPDMVSLALVDTVAVASEQKKDTQIKANVEQETKREKETSKPKVDIDLTQSVLSSTTLSVQELQNGLLKQLKPLASTFIEAEQQTGINAVFLASIASLESGHGTSPIATSHNNLFGWTSETGYVPFENKEQCILKVAHNIKSNYLVPDGMYFSGYSISDVNKYYNGTQEWENTVIQVSKEIKYRASKQTKQ